MDYNRFTKGSEWRKWDLHFHTPSSYDYGDKSVIIEHIIETLSKNEIAVVAITDHHHIDTALIKSLQTEGNKKGITILPGIEFLSDAKGKQPVHFIGIFSENSNIDYIWGQIKNKTAIHKIDGEGKRHNEVYCHLTDTINLVKELGGIVTIHAGDKSNSVENITHSLPHGEAQKTDIAHAIHVYELGKEEDQTGYREIVFPSIKKVIPMIICTDNHNINKYVVKQNCWIKADPTFEGLRQILYEPESRIAIQANLPEDKAGYQVIDRIEINNENIYNICLQLNPNLNTIIGGRSTGKSILLGLIAKKLKTDLPVVIQNAEYDDFIRSISATAKVFWKDGKEDDNREIEYFQQGYMNELAKNEDKLNKLIQTILYQKGKETILNVYDKSVAENKRKILESVNSFFQVLKDINEKEQKIREKGDKNGIEEEIAKLSSELNKLSTISISEEEKDEYERHKESISNSQQKSSTVKSDIQRLEELKEVLLMKEEISYELTSISEERRAPIQVVFEKLKNEVSEKWKSELDLIIKESIAALEEIEKAIKLNIDSPVYIKVSKAFKESVQLAEYEGKIQVQKAKLFEINSLFGEIEKLKTYSQELKENIKKSHQSYFLKINELVPQLYDSQSGLEIKAKVKFNQSLYSDILYSGLNQQGYTNQSISGFKHTGDNQAYEVHLFDLLDNLINNTLTLKGAYNNQSLSSRLFSECFYEYSYDIEYERDNFQKMSDGKKAFVVLKLLLDFSNKDCPILIDQPEDDLDNRSIYWDLVQYLKKKKTQRQIIIATHNPNIVVGADSELVICANQDGEKTANRDNKKFQYVAGSLEHTLTKTSGTNEVLEAQGIREHVCEILEGGDIAFKLRENKYSIKL